MSKFPARVHPILARNAQTALILRRGPSKSVCTIHWDRTNDQFTLGQWLRGRIYERRSDLSPDGKHFLYFAMNGKWGGPVQGAWTAISRAPYLKALALWPWGDCWNGGGLFVSDHEFWRNVGFHGSATDIVGNLPGHFTELEACPLDNNYGGECPGVYYVRLLRDGWKFLLDTDLSAHDRGAVFEKQLPGGWVLEKTAHATSRPPAGKGCYYDTHRLLHPETGVISDRRDWEWAELDGNRLVWVSQGVLFASPLDDIIMGTAEVLHNFNDMTFEAIEAPY